jgi:hypothetical protein
LHFRVLEFSQEKTFAYQGMVSTSIADNKVDVLPLSADLITTELDDMQKIGVALPDIIHSTCCKPAYAHACLRIIGEWLCEG